MLGVIERKTEKSRLETLTSDVNSLKTLLQGQGGRRAESGSKGEDRKQGGFSPSLNINQQRVNGKRVCHRFNRAGGCSRQAVPGGCKDNAGEFAHVCSFFDRVDKKFCLKNHAKMDHK